MATPEDTGQAPERGAAAGGNRARWKKHRVWLGTVLTSAVVIPLVAWAAGWIGHKGISVVSPEHSSGRLRLDS
jgi:hypothetical protein